MGQLDDPRTADRQGAETDTATDPGGGTGVERPSAATKAPAAAAVRDPQGSDPKPRSLYQRMKLYFFRTTLGRTRRDKSDV